MAIAIHSTLPVELPASIDQQPDAIDSIQQVLSFSRALDLPNAQLYTNLPRGIHSDVEDIIRTHPTRTAVEHGIDGVKLTYEELNNLACQVATQLIRAGIEREELVPVVASRTPYAVAAIMGVLKAGGAYVPCDAEEWTRERLNSVLAVVKPKNIVVSDPAFVSLLSSYPSVNIVETPKISAPITTALFSRPVSNNLAYVIMTSGSTGTPKGVMVEHRNLMQYIRRFESDQPANLNVHAGDRIFLVYSIAFDAFSGVMWSTICNGGTLCLADKSDIASVAKTVSVLPATPSLLSSLTPSEFPNIRSVFSGGEALSLSLVRSWASPERRIFNCYGPTETTCVSTMTEITAKTSKVTIGRPLAGYATLILDTDLKPVAVGVSGEIVIGGAGVGRGYLGNARQTEESFVNIDWVDQLIGGRSSGKWYRTGDYAKWTADGTLEYLGRADWRIKNRGFLIDLEGDVEHTMVADWAVSDARAFMVHGRLVGVVTPGFVDTKALRDRLLEHTPAYMVCNQIWALDDFPRTSNDKIDRKALQSAVETLMEDDLVENGPEPSTAAECIIADGFRMLFDITGTVGVKAAFIEMGGHSLMAIRLVSFAKAAGLLVTFQDVLRCNTVGAIAAASQLLSTAQDDVETPTISTENQQVLSSVLGPDFEAVAEDISALTPSQRGMFMETVSKRSVYVLQTQVLLQDKTGSFDVERFYTAWEHIVQRHSIFRSSFHLDHSIQVVHKDVPRIPRNIHVMATASQVNDAIEDYVRDDFEAGFTLDDLSLPGQMMRLAIFAVAGSSYATFVWTVHHGLIDGVSATILQEELISLYEDGVLPSHSAPNPRSFASVAREIVSNQAAQGDAAASFWRQHLEEAATAAPLNLPMLKDTTNSAGSEIVFDSNLHLDEVAAFAQKCGVTITTVFLAAAAVVLTQYTDKPDAVLGVVYTGRSATAHADQVVGPVVNTLPVFVSVEDGELAVKDLLRSLSEKVLSVASWEWSSLGSAMAAAGIPSNTSLFDFAFSFADDFASIPISQAATSGSRLQLLDIEQKELTQFPFTITFERNKTNRQTASVRIRQQPQRIHDDLALNLGGHLCNAVASLMTQDRIKDVHITDERERHFLAKELNSHHTEPYRPTVTVCERLTRSLKTHGDLPAIARGSDSISYAELDRRSDAVAYYLAAHHGVKVGSTVGILAMHHIDWLVGACGIVKAGAAYLPIDAGYPAERQAWIFNQGDNTGVLLAPCAPAHGLFDDVKVLLVSDIVGANTPPIQLWKPSVQDVVTYLYTSGSTGVPKGVPLTQSGLDISLQPDFGHLWAAPGRRTALMVALGFDCAFLSTFGSLMYGGCVVLQQPDDPLEHLKDVHCLMCTPSMLASLNENEYKHLDSVALAGEALPQGIADMWSPGRRLINMYGPSECHVFATYKFLPPGEQVSLGRPLPTGRIYIVDPQTCKLVPVGLTGEIWIGGSSPTFGYVGLDEATAAKFIPDPFGHPGERVYRTGDVGRWNMKGEVDYIGRTDDMIKVKGGFRLSLIGVENALNREASHFLGTHLNSATVVVVKDRLVAYISPSTIDVVALKDRLMDTEPHFAVPKWIIAMDSLPTTPNQKVDKKALIARGLPQTEEHFEAPRTTTERTLASLWKDILEMSEDVSATAHFVRLGGTSLNHIRLVSALQRHYHVKVPLTLTVWNPILRNQGAVLDELLVKEGKQVVEEVVLEDLDLGMLSYSEQGMFVLSQNSPTKTPFTVSVFYTVHGHVDVGHLKEAFDIVLRRHTISRARYTTDDTGNPRRQLDGAAPQARILTPSEFHGSLERNVNYVFDLASEHLIRVFLSSDGGKTDVLFTAHHIVVDHWTIDILMKEASSVYAALCSGTPTELPPVSLDYPQWAASASQRLPGVDSAKFWEEYLRDIPDCIDLPLSRNRPAVDNHAGKSRFFDLPQELRSAVELSASSMGVTLHQFFSAALLLVLSGFAGQDDIVIGASHANRATADEYELCGLFLDRIPFRTAYKGEKSTEDLLRSIAASQQAASLHFDLPFDEIVRAVQCRQDLGRHPIFQVMLSVENEQEALPKLRVPDAVVENNMVAPRGANFDILMAYQLLPNNGGMRLRFEASEIYGDALVDAIEEAMRTALGSVAEGTRSPAQIRSLIAPLTLKGF